MLSNSQVAFEIYQKMMAQKIISAYHGEFTQQVINMLLKQAKWDLEYRKVDKITIKKSYSILVECLENILKHTTQMKQSGSDISKAQIDGIVILGYDEGDFYIMVGNLVDTNSVETLKNRIIRVNSLDKEGLKSLHTEVLVNGSISEKGGAGLGLIEIAMKSRNNIDFEFSQYDEELSFFAMQIKLSSSIIKLEE